MVFFPFLVLSVASSYLLRHMIALQGGTAYLASVGIVLLPATVLSFIHFHYLELHLLELINQHHLRLLQLHHTLHQHVFSRLGTEISKTAVLFLTAARILTVTTIVLIGIGILILDVIYLFSFLGQGVL